MKPNGQEKERRREYFFLISFVSLVYESLYHVFARVSVTGATAYIDHLVPIN